MQSTLQKRQKQAHQTTQAFSVVQNVLECGIAEVCHRRRLFPDCFFTHPSMGSRGPTVTQFDMTVIANASTPAVNSRSSERNCNNVSPLASSVAENPFDQTASRTGSSSQTHSDFDLLRAEALVLLYWIKQGVGEAIQKGLLARVNFGICIPIKSSHIRHDHVQSAAQTLFRNLEGFVTTLQPLGSYLDVYQLNHQESKRSSSAPQSLTNIVPSSRYMILRVESVSCEVFSQMLLPDALTLAHPIMGNNHLTNADAQADSKRGDATIAEGMRLLVSTSLGNVVEEHVSGIGVKLTAYSLDDDADNVHLQKDNNMPIHEIDCAQGDEFSNDNTSMSDSLPPIKVHHLQLGTRAVAIPFGLGSCANYIDCVIKDHRMDNKKGRQYKVAFSSRKLQSMGMKKQWIKSDNVLSVDSMLEMIRHEFHDVHHHKTSSTDDDDDLAIVIATVAQKLRVDTTMVEVAIATNYNNRRKRNLAGKHEIERTGDFLRCCEHGVAGTEKTEEAEPHFFGETKKRFSYIEFPIICAQSASFEAAGSY